MVSVHKINEQSAVNFEEATLAGLAPEQQERVRHALEFVVERTQDAPLDTGETAQMHMVGVVRLLAELRTDADTRIAGLLSPLCYFNDDFEKKAEHLFGKEVSRILLSLRQLYRLRARLSHNQQVHASWASQSETLRKMLLAMSADLRVVMIRLCSRLQTLRYFSNLDDIKAQEGPRWQLAAEHASETMELYAPLANRLGLWQLKWELEDLAFRIQEPSTYKHVAKMLDEKRVEREEFIRESINQIDQELRKVGIEAEITGRPKHIHSIWNKMRLKGVSFEKLYDVRACRIIVDDVKSCYTALSLVHSLWEPIPSEFDDYIAKPKPNGYQSLHTVIKTATGKTLEIQIRTHAMHRFAEFGVAAHWRYKESGKDGLTGNSRAQGDFEDRIAWLRQLLAWKDDVSDQLHTTDSGDEKPDLWSERLKTSLLDNVVYVFTPEARILELPKGATPVDFAYYLHTDLGHRCRGARVDGHLVPLNTALNNGQTIEIITARGDQSNIGPSRDWLNSQLGYLASQRAKQKVRRWFAQQELQETLDRGRAIVDKELQRLGKTATAHEELAIRLGLTTAADLYGALAREELSPRAIEHLLKPPQNEVVDAEQALLNASRRRSTGKSSGNGVLVVGVDALMTHLARCCRPAPPDEIIGFITRGKGIAIHRADCSNLVSIAREQSERLIETTWGQADDRLYPVDLVVLANDRQGLLRDITEVFSREKINVISVNTQSSQNVARMQFTAEVKNAEHLQRALTQLGEIKGVFETRRR